MSKTTDHIIETMNQEKDNTFTYDDWKKNPQRTTIIIKNVNKTIDGTYTIESQGEFGNGSYYKVKDVHMDHTFWTYENREKGLCKGKGHDAWQVWFSSAGGSLVTKAYLDIGYHSNKNYMNKTLRQDQFELL